MAVEAEISLWILLGAHYEAFPDVVSTAKIYDCIH